MQEALHQDGNAQTTAINNNSKMSERGEKITVEMLLQRTNKASKLQL
jgi:hypothetical protein